MTSQTTNLDAPSRNWRRITRHPAVMEYRRLAFLVAAANIAVLAVGLRDGMWFADGMVSLSPIADLALINLTLGILIRQQRVVNALFWLATRIPVTWPLWIRWGAGKVFHFGGLHSGGTVAGALWLVALTAGIVFNRLNGASVPSNVTLGLTALMVALMGLMIATAIGPIRARFHNRFEKIHRFVGWTVLLLFWGQTVSLARDNGLTLTESPAFWALCVITLSILAPWLSLKRVKVQIDKPSNHVAIAGFDYGDTPFAGSSNAISHTPFGEYHSFANIPTPGRQGYRLAISRAGDWTGAFIDEPPSHVWVKGITTSGVARIEDLFTRVVYVGTGSGIGPILPHLLKRAVPNRLIWSTRSPRATYGDAIMDEIEAHTDQPLIWDTDTQGKPNLSVLALQAVRDFDAEAVIVISNQKLTRKVVYDMERLGIPAYGAIWDS